MKKIIVGLVALSMLAGCSNGGISGNGNPTGKELKVTEEIKLEAKMDKAKIIDKYEQQKNGEVSSESKLEEQMKGKGIETFQSSAEEEKTTQILFDIDKHIDDKKEGE